MSNYATLDHLSDLTFSQMAGARTLAFEPHFAAGTGWDRVASVTGFNSGALLHSIYKFTAVAGATYDLFSTSYFDPFLLRVFDSQGNAIVANHEADDGAPLVLSGVSYDQDVIFNWVAPYSGTYYVEANWNQGNFYKYYSLNIYEDKDTASANSAASNVIASLNAGNPLPSAHRMTGDEIIDAMTTGYRWSLDGTRVIDFSISSGFSGEYWINPSEVTASLKAALATFSTFANVKFNYLGQFVDPTQAARAGSEINLSLDSEWTFFSAENQWARAFFPAPSYSQSPYTGAAGDVYLNINSDANSLPSYSPGSAGWFLLLHELGHSLGLKHPHDDGGTGRPTLSDIGFDALDMDWATIMSYNDEAFANLVEWDPSTPMVLDALALQYLYGPNTSTHAGQSVHVLQDQDFYTTLWDASGIDTLDVQAQAEGWTIILPHVTLTTSVNTKVGLALTNSDMVSDVPSNVIWLLGDFENVRGSAFDDVIFTNALDNQIQAGGGRDTVSWDQPHGQYRISATATGWMVQDTQDQGSVDQLQGVERLAFSDRTIALDLDGHAGTVAKVLGAVFGAASVRNLDFVGIGLHFMDDAGYSAESLMQLALQARLGSQASHGQVVDLLYTQVMQEPPTADVRQGFVDWLDSGQETVASLGVMAAETAFNRANIDLVGLARTGLAYLPFEG
ncbi:MAG: hypothetical protein RLZZ280_190 [Pseudomonadota bacterium]